MSVFNDIISRLDSVIRQLSLNSICRNIKRNCQEPHQGVFVQQREYWLADQNGLVSGKSSETLLNLAMVCFAKRPNFKFGNAFSANFSSLKTRSTGTFVRPTISCPRHQNFIHDIQINKSRP